LSMDISQLDALALLRADAERGQHPVTSSVDPTPRLTRWRHVGREMVDRTDGDYVRWADVVKFFPVIGSDLLCQHCAKQFCPNAEPMHFDKDGCPCCDADVARPDATEQS
jgi:hypothetical protein